MAAIIGDARGGVCWPAPPFVARRFTDPEIERSDSSPQVRSARSVTFELSRAVHAAMAGKTGMLVGRWHCTFVHLPLHMVTHGRRKVDPRGDLWHSVLASTGQPPRLY